MKKRRKQFCFIVQFRWKAITYMTQLESLAGLLTERINAYNKIYISPIVGTSNDFE